MADKPPYGVLASPTGSSALRSIFNLYDIDGTGAIPIKDVDSILRKIGYADGEKRTLYHPAMAAPQHGLMNPPEAVALRPPI